MADRTLEYRWYLVGCDRLGHTPLSLEVFEAKWQEYEDYAESLKQAEEAGTLARLEPVARLNMERKIQSDPLLKAVLVGQSEESSQNPK
jgi:hypothetical protein